MTLSDFYNKVAARADTDKQKIDATIVRRVLSEAFLEMSKMKTTEALAFIHRGISTANKKKALKKKAATRAVKKTT